MRVCIYVYMYMRIYVHMCICVYVSTGVRVHVCMCVCVYVCMCVCVYVRVMAINMPTSILTIAIMRTTLAAYQITSMLLKWAPSQNLLEELQLQH